MRGKLTVSIALAVLAAPVAALAQGATRAHDDDVRVGPNPGVPRNGYESGAAWSPPAIGGGPGSDRSIDVQLDVRERTRDGCDYRANVRGAVHRHFVPGATADDAWQYTPRLALHATLRCPNDAASHDLESMLHGATYAASDLAYTLASRLTLTSEHGDARCRYRPQIVFDGHEMSSAGVHAACEVAQPARGGGPPPTSNVPHEAFPGPLGIGSGPAIQNTSPISTEPLPSARGGGPASVIPRDAVQHSDALQGASPFAPPNTRNGDLRGTGRGLTGGGPYGTPPAQQPEPSLP